MSEQLPSVDDLLESKLPSVDEFIKEEDLPSVDEFIGEEPPRPEEEIADNFLENPDESDEIEAEKIDLTEVLRLINDVRKDIPVVPEIPEIKYYDEELEKLTAYVEEIKESIPEIPEQKTYDVEVEAICDLIDNLREEVKDLPVPKYYEEEIETLQKKVDGFYQDMLDLPEPKYYEEDLKSLKEDVLAVKESIPKFPKWVNEVNEVPDFSWIGKTFSVIDDDFIKVNDNLDFVKGRIDQEVQKLSEDIDVKRFESKTDIDKLNSDLKETKDKIYKELREAALKIHETKHSFKNDDRLLKKNILSKYNVLKQRVEEEVKEFNRKNDATKDLYGGYFDGLTQEISNLPEVKYYDEDIKEIREEIKIDADNLKSLKELVQEIKEKQIKFKQEFNEVRDLQEGLLNEPTDKAQSVDGTGDPLAPLDKQFRSLKELADHYRLFISRTQQQIATIGGGGAGFIKDLADVSFTESTGTNKLLIYNGDEWVGIASTALSPIITLHDALGNGNVSGIGISVGVVTATNGYFSGIVTAAQLNYDVVTDIYSTGIVTATKGIQVTTLGLNVASGISTLAAGALVKAGAATTALVVEGDARITGILTIGTGSVTIDGSDNKVKIGTGVTLTSTGDSDFVGIVTAKGFEVGSAATISNNGNATFAGIVTAASFVGDGSGLVGVANTDNVSSTTLSVAGVTTSTGGLYVGTAASIFANGNVTCGIVTATKYYGDGSSLSNVTSTTINNNANNRLITGSGTANTLEGESTLTYNGTALSVSTGATIFTNGNIACGIITATSFTVAGTSLAETIADTVGGMVSSNTETGITVTYEDGDNTLDFVVGTLNQDTTGTAALAEGLTGTPNIDCATGSFTGDVDIADKIVHTGDTNTAIRFPDADTITAETGGSERLRIDSSGDVGINIAAPVAQLQVNTTKNAETDRHDATNYALALRNPNDNNGEAVGLRFGITSNTTKVGAAILHERDAGGSQGSLQFYTSSDGSSVTERLRIKSDGSLNVGTAATIHANGIVTCGIITATNLVGNGSGLTNISGIPTEADTAVSSTSATTVLSLSASTYRAAIVDVLITQGSAYQAGQYGLIHDGTTATIVEQWAVATGSMLGTLTATVSGGNMLLQVNMGSSSSATVTVKSSTITV